MIAIIDYKAGNIRSLQTALNRLGYDSLLTDDHDQITRADKVILPGVGEAGSAMSNLRAKGLDRLIIRLKQPFLGICLGLQLLCEHSEESNTTCLGIFNTKVRKFKSTHLVPHMGWNEFSQVNGALFRNIKKEENVYFVHSYYADLCDETSAVCDYITPFSAALERNNFFATQFHPEKSASVGEKILQNFLDL